MAFTFTLLKQIVAGSERQAIYKVTADTTYSGSVQTPVGFIDAVLLTPLSAAVISGAINVKANANTGTVSAANGAFLISGCVNGDVYYAVVYGRS